MIFGKVFKTKQCPFTNTPTITNYKGVKLFFGTRPHRRWPQGHVNLCPSQTSSKVKIWERKIKPSFLEHVSRLLTSKKQKDAN